MDSKLNSALALTKTQVIQNYHVFAYITASDLSSVTEENPILGSIIILASFSDSVDPQGKHVSGREQAIQYAKDMISLTGHELIFWTHTHKWFHLRPRPKVREVYFIDDKSALEDATNYMNVNRLKRVEKETTQFDQSIEEERKLHRSRCNPDHVEHFISNLQAASESYSMISEYRKQLQAAEQAYHECSEKLKSHYAKHPGHEKDALNLLKVRLTQPEFVNVAYVYTQIKSEGEEKIYEKKTTTSERNSVSDRYSVGDRHSVSDRPSVGEKCSEKSLPDKSYSDVAASPSMLSSSMTSPNTTSPISNSSNAGSSNTASSSTNSTTTTSTGARWIPVRGNKRKNKGRRP